MGCTATFSAHNNMDDCPDLAVSAACHAVTLSNVEDDGPGESSGCCWRTRCEGIALPTPGGMTRLDPSGEERLGRCVLVG
jgi:hypothetical protein